MFYLTKFVGQIGYSLIYNFALLDRKAKTATYEL